MRLRWYLLPCVIRAGELPRLRAAWIWAKVTLLSPTTALNPVTPLGRDDLTETGLPLTFLGGSFPLLVFGPVDFRSCDRNSHLGATAAPAASLYNIVSRKLSPGELNKS